MNTASRAYGKTFLRTLLFLSAPLTVEMIVYLCRPEIRPRPAAAGSVAMLLVDFALLFSVLAAALTPLLQRLPLRIEALFPSLFFGLFTALAASRLLPFDSGLSPARCAVFVAAAVAGCLTYALIHRLQLRLPRLLLTCFLFNAAAAYALGFLFEPPLHNAITVFLMACVMMVALLMLPGKVLAGAVVVAGLFQFHARTVLPAFAPPNKMEAFRSVVLIGVDGLSPEVVRKMAAAGRLPTFAGLMKNGVSGRLHTIAIPFSPLVWNTIYTGTEPRRHGIMAFTSTRVAGAGPFLSLWLDNWTNSDWIHRSVDILKKAGAIHVGLPVTSRDRREPALWNMVEQNGGSSVVAGGWTTFPPEMISGTYVSDYAAYTGKPLGTYYPMSHQVDDLLAVEPDVSGAPEEIRRYLAKDEKIHNLSLELFRKASTDTRFLFAYYCAVDAFGHHYGTFMDMKSTPGPRREELIRMREDVYRRIDQYLKDYIDMMDDGTLLIVCSDHGFHFDKRQHNYPVDGVVLMVGRGIRQNTVIEGSVYDVAPTVLYALGLAPSSGFQGRPMKQAFEGIVPQPQPRMYERGTKFFEVPGLEGLDEQKLQELQDLQYIDR